MMTSHGIAGGKKAEKLPSKKQQLVNALPILSPFLIASLSLCAVRSVADKTATAAADITVATKNDDYWCRRHRSVGRGGRGRSSLCSDSGVPYFHHHQQQQQRGKARSYCGCGRMWRRRNPLSFARRALRGKRISTLNNSANASWRGKKGWVGRLGFGTRTHQSFKFGREPDQMRKIRLLWSYVCRFCPPLHSGREEDSGRRRDGREFLPVITTSANCHLARRSVSQRHKRQRIPSASCMKWPQFLGGVCPDRPISAKCPSQKE